MNFGTPYHGPLVFSNEPCDVFIIRFQNGILFIILMLVCFNFDSDCL